MSEEPDQETTLTVVVDDSLGFKSGVANSEFVQSSEHGLTADGPARLQSDGGAAVVTIEPSIDIEEGGIHIDTYTGQLLGLTDGGEVTIRAVQFDYAEKITYRNSVEIDDINQATDELERVIKERFMDKFVGPEESLPVAAGDTQISLEVETFQPDDVGCVRVSEETEIDVELVDRGSMTGTIPSARDLEITYDDLYGRFEAQDSLRDYLQNPLTEMDLFQTSSPPSGVILHGPKGAGKTHFAMAIANEVDATMRVISGDALEQDDLEAAASLRDVFDDARRYQPAVVIIENLSRVVGNGGGTLATTLKSELDKIDADDRVVVLGEVDHVSNVPDGFLQSGRFEHDVWVGLPDSDARRKLIEDVLEDVAHTLSEEDIDALAMDAVGYTGRGIQDMFTKASIRMQRRLRKSYGNEYETLSDVIEEEGEGVNMNDVANALDDTTLHVLSQYNVADIYYSDTEWDDLVGLDDAVQQLTDLVAGPEAAPDLYTDDEAVNGLLMYGSRGTGKTAIVEAVAATTNRPIIQLNMTHLMRDASRPVDEVVHEVLLLARDLEPTLVHLTHLHSLGLDTRKARAVTDQLRNEFDALTQADGVHIVGETETPYDPEVPLSNQTDLYGALHPSLLQHGRFGHHVHVPLPSDEVRRELLEQRLAGIADGETVQLGALEPDELVALSEGLSGGDLEHICVLSRRHARRALLGEGETALALNVGEKMTIEQEHVVAAINEYRTTRGEADTDAEEDEQQDDEADGGEDEDDDDDDGFMWE